MQKIRVLNVQPRIPFPLLDGGARAMWTISEMLRSQPSLEYAVLAMNTTRHWVNPDDIPAVYRDIPYWWAPVDNRIHPLGALWNLIEGTPYHISRFWSSAFALQLRKVLEKFTPHVVLLEGVPLLQYVELFRRYSTAAVVYHAHNIEHLIWQRLANADRNIMRRLYLREQVRRLAHYESDVFQHYNLDGIVTHTNNDATAVRSLGYRGNIHVMPFAVQLDDLEPSYAPEEVPTLFHIGSLGWEPNRQGIEWFLREIFPLIRKYVPRAELHLAGQIPPHAAIPSGEGVHWHGKVPDAFEFMRGRSILVVPLRAGSGVRVKIIEAMALGKAIVSTSIGVEGIECEAGTHLLIADTPAEFAEAAVRLLQNRSFVEQLGRNARRFAEKHHNFTRVGHQLSEFLIAQAMNRL